MTVLSHTDFRAPAVRRPVVVGRPSGEAPFRGIAFGLLLVAPFWIGLALLIMFLT